MTTRLRVGVTSAVLLTGTPVVAAVAGSADWGRAGLDVWNLPALRAECEEVAAERAHLNARHRQLVAEGEACGRVHRLLAAGCMDLAAATEMLIVITSERAEYVDHLARALPEVRTHRGRVARRATTRALQLLADHPTRSAEVSARLTAQLAAIEGDAAGGR